MGGLSCRDGIGPWAEPENNKQDIRLLSSLLSDGQTKSVSNINILHTNAC